VSGAVSILSHIRAISGIARLVVGQKHTKRRLERKRNMKTIKSASSGIGFTGVLQIVFIVLKLCGLIGWSWLWVLAPMWISAIIVACVIIAHVILEVVFE
jgi:Flp pilus assembly protein TadB